MKSKLTQLKSRKAKTSAKIEKASPSAKTLGVSQFIAEQAAKQRGVADFHARKPGTRAL